MKRTLRKIGVTAAGLLLLSSSSFAAERCDRQCLMNIADRYVDAVTHHDLSRAPLAKAVRYSDQGIFMAPGDGVWRTIDAVPAKPHLYVTDVEKAEVVYVGIVQEGVYPAIFSARLKVDDKKISEAEIFLGRHGIDNFAPERWTQPDPLLDSILPKEQRRNREQMIAIADAYLEGIARATDKGTSFDPDCNRFEHGVQTTNLKTPDAPKFLDLSCQAQFALGAAKFHTAVTDRRVLAVDEERGLITMSAFIETNGSMRTFPLADGTQFTMPPERSRPSAAQIVETFKIRDGKILSIHAVYERSLYGMQSGWAGGTHLHKTGDHD